MTTDRATRRRADGICIDSVTVTPIERLSFAGDGVIVVGTSISLITA